MALVLAAPFAARAQDDEDVKQAIMDLAHEQWKAEMDGASADKIAASLADDYTEFNPMAPTRIDGKKMAVRMIEAGIEAGEMPTMAEMLNPKVQVYGDTAILTYNYMGMLKNENSGESYPNMAKSTRVYVKDGRNWKLVHANFAPVTPPPGA